MGLLAESKSRRKISKDPNNTRWTQDTSTFGQRILRAQGWEPGQYLGSKDAGHSVLHTAANASYIRVSVKDGMTGLGFGKAKEDEVPGLDVFSDLLSRLNGKSKEDVEGDRRARLAVKTDLFVERRWGAMRFVSGGLLVGDTVQKQLASVESAAAGEAGEKDMSRRESSQGTSKKRKLTSDEEKDPKSESESELKKQKKRRKEERRARKGCADPALDGSENATRSSDAKPKKKSKKLKPSSGDDVDAEEDQPNSTDSALQKEPRKSRSKHKKKPDSAVDDDSGMAETRSKGKKDKSKRKKKKMKAESAEPRKSEPMEQEDDTGPTTVTEASTPLASGTGTSTPTGGRHFARARFIAAKRQATLDTKTLNQISCQVFLTKRFQLTVL